MKDIYIFVYNLNQWKFKLQVETRTYTLPATLVLRNMNAICRLGVNIPYRKCFRNAWQPHVKSLASCSVPHESWLNRHGGSKPKGDTSHLSILTAKMKYVYLTSLDNAKEDYEGRIL